MHHYFGTKRELFVATVELPFDPSEIVAAGVLGVPQEAGERIVRQLLTIWATEHGQTLMQSLLRSALTDDRVLRMLREFMLETVLTPIAEELAPDHPRLRATLRRYPGHRARDGARSNRSPRRMPTRSPRRSLRRCSAT